MEPVGDHALELLPGVGEAAAETAHGEGGADDERVAEVLCEADSLLDRVRDVGACDLRTGLDDEVLEELAVLPLLDGLEVGPDELDVVLFQDAVLVQLDRRVEGGLTAEGRQDRIRALLRDDRLDDLPGDRLDVGGVGEVRVRHDRRWIRVDEDDSHALLTQHSAGLRAGVVELARLADDDGAGTDHEDGADVGAPGHLSAPPGRR